MRRMAVLALAGTLTACGGPDVRDGPPAGRVDPDAIPEPTPRAEPRSPYGNHTPYTVLGRTYHVLDSAAGYHETGRASWYGSKFHGKPTSSGEPYDMYKATAAHRTLPLPTFVRVTNLENGRDLVVRVNDRGPFHSDRIIDLSWGAALKLGIVDAGTARVRVEAIDTGRRGGLAVQEPRTLPVHIQVGAFSDRDRARRVRSLLERERLGPVDIERTSTRVGRVWRVRIGPVRRAGEAKKLFGRILELGLDRPVYVYEN